MERYSRITSTKPEYRRFMAYFGMGLGLIILLWNPGIDSFVVGAIAAPTSPQIAQTTTIAPAEPTATQSPTLPAPPTTNTRVLVNSGPDRIIYIGLGLMIITIVNIIGLFSEKVKGALIFGSILSLALIALLWFL